MLETEIKKLTEAVQELTAKLNERFDEPGSEPNPPDPTPAEKDKNPEKVSSDDVRAVLTDMIEKLGKGEPKTLLQRFGANTFSKLEEKDYAAVIAEGKKLLATDDNDGDGGVFD